MRFDGALDDAFHGRSHVQVLRALSGLPVGFPVSAREIARRAGVAHTTASSVLEHLRTQGLVRVRRAPWGDGHELNRNHVLAGGITEIFELERSLREVVIQFLSDEIRTRALGVVAAYLFGSVAWGEMESTSDVDLAVLCSLEDLSKTEVGLQQIAEAFRTRFGNELSVLIKALPEGIDKVGKDVRGRKPESRLWTRILKEGIPVISPPRLAKSTSD